MWKVVHASVQGVAHSLSGQPCQDHSVAKRLEVDGEHLLIIACADGAGSAPKAAEGAAIACTQAIRLLESAICCGDGAVFESDERLHGVFEQVREKIRSAASTDGDAIRDFASTLLTAAIGDHRAVFAQVGDGAIVIRSADELTTVFWPQSGEYANTTRFITDDESTHHFQVRFVRERITDVAVFTDGLERLALRFANQTVHAPFFEPMLAKLREADDGDQLTEPLRVFLSSPQVNERTDDDKTLVLGTRAVDRNER